MSSQKLEVLEKTVSELEHRIAGSVDYDSYMKAHPKSKKQRNDPMFKQPQKAAPGKTPTSKAPTKVEHSPKVKKKTEIAAKPWKQKNPGLSSNQNKGVEKAIEILKRDNNKDINKHLKKFEQGKITREELADVCEDWNWHACAALLRADKYTDVDVVVHADSRHNGIDLGGDSEKEQYANERQHLFDARYEATDPDQRHGIKRDPDSFDMNRHFNALTYLNHHGMHGSPTAKRLRKQIESKKGLYKKHFNEMSKSHDENLSREKNELLNFKPDPRHPSWTKEDQLNHVMNLQKAKEKHLELGKSLGLN